MIVNELLIAEFSPGEVAVNVYIPVAPKTNPLNVATPFTAFTVALTNAGLDVTVTAALEPVTTFPFASCTCATTGDIVAPVAALAG